MSTATTILKNLLFFLTVYTNFKYALLLPASSNILIYNCATVNSRSDMCPVAFMESLLWSSTVVPQHSSIAYFSLITLPQWSVHTSPQKCQHLNATTCTFTIAELSSVTDGQILQMFPLQAILDTPSL